VQDPSEHSPSQAGQRTAYNAFTGGGGSAIGDVVVPQEVATGNGLHLPIVEGKIGLEQTRILALSRARPREEFKEFLHGTHGIGTTPTYARFSPHIIRQKMRILSARASLPEATLPNRDARGRLTGPSAGAVTASQWTFRADFLANLSPNPHSAEDQRANPKQMQ
jgi:hypothetical protein